MIEMVLSSIRVQLPDNVPVVLLREQADTGRTLPILIGHEEATAIARAQQGIQPPRPLTHDLMKDLLEGLGVSVDAIVITELRQSIFYAEIRLSRGEEKFAVSSRPSDAIALAVRTNTPIFADEELLDAEGLVVEDDGDDDRDEGQQEQVIEQFQRFISEVRPEDFKT